MATIAEIKTRVRNSVIDLPTATDDRIVEWIQRAQEVAEDSYAWKVMEAEHVFTTAEDVRQLGLKSALTRYQRRDGKPWWIDGLGGTHPIDWIDTKDEIARQFSAQDPTQKNAPRRIHERDDTPSFDVYPLPDANNPVGTVYSDGNYRVVIPYLSRQPILVPGSVDTNWFSENAAYFLELRAFFEALMHNRETGQATTELARANAELIRVKRRAKEAVLAGRTLIPVRDVRAPLTQRRGGRRAY